MTDRAARTFGAVSALMGLGVTLEGWRLGLFRYGIPGAGFFPFWAGLVLAVAGVAMALGRGGGEPTDELFRPGPRAAIVTAGAFLLLVHVTGFIMASVAYLLVTLVVLKRHPAWVVAVSAAITVGLLYFVFEVWLGIPLPRGLFG